MLLAKTDFTVQEEEVNKNLILAHDIVTWKTD